jgi:hypothetical protein
MKVAIGVVLASLSLSMATYLYWGEPVYLAIFALTSVVFAAYVWLMGRLFKKRLSTIAFLSIWAGGLLLMSLFEGWRHWQSPNENVGAVPTAVQALAHRNNPYLLPDKKQSTPSPPASPPLPPPSVIDSIDERRDLGALVLAEKCNDDYFEELRETAFLQIKKQVELPERLDDVQSIQASEAMIYASKKDQALFQKIFQDEVQNFRTATEKGQGILSHFSGPNILQAKEEFLRIQNELVSRAQTTDQQLVPYFKLQEQLMGMALYVKQGGRLSGEYRDAWADDMRLLSTMGGDFSNQRLMEDVRDQHEEIFRKLMAMTFDKDYSRKAETFLIVPCVYKLPMEASDPNLVAPYVSALGKTWQTDAWLTKGRALAESVYVWHGSKPHGGSLSK